MLGTEVSLPALATMSVLMAPARRVRFGLLQVERAETLGKPAVDQSEEITGFGIPASVASQARVGCGAARECSTSCHGCPSTSAILFMAVLKKEYLWPC